MNTTLNKTFVNTVGDTFTLIKRNKVAAIYKRESVTGDHIEFDVFALLKNKDGNEVYPEKHAFGIWAWCPFTEARANTYFNRLTNGDTGIPEVDPETSQVKYDVNELGYTDLTDGVSVDIQVTQTDVADIFHPIDTDLMSVQPTESVPTVTPEIIVSNTDDDVIVTIATIVKSKVKNVLNIPIGEFTQAQFAAANDLPARGVVYGKIQSQINAGLIKFVELRQLGKGRPTSIYSVVV